METPHPSEHNNTGENRSINVSGNATGGIYNSGELHIHTGSTAADIWATFEDYNHRAIRQARPHIEGLTEPIPRPEVAQIEDLWQKGLPVVLIGLPGTGKSGIGFQLLQNVLQRGQVGFLLDCRVFSQIHNSSDLQHRLGLGSLSLHRACLSVRSWKGSSLPFVLLIDQIDSVVGTSAEEEFTQLAIDCQGRADMRVLVISRRSEMQERRLLERLHREKFHDVPSAELPNAHPYLQQLGIENPSHEAERLARNLLNLSVMSTIRQKNPDFDFANLTSEVALWNERLEVFLRSNVVNGPHWLAELTRLAAQALKHPGGIFHIGNPPLESHRRLLSEGFIESQPHALQVCAFVHENLQDFLYAKNAVQTGRSVAWVIEDLGRFRGQGALVWMDRIVAFNDPDEPNREAIIRSLLNVPSQ